MARIVLVHGIAQEQLSSEALEEVWIPALIGGIRNAGAIPTAESLRLSKSSIRMAFYGDLFLSPGTQGGEIGFDDLLLDTRARQLAERLGHEWMNRAVEINPQDQYLLDSSALDPRIQAQGLRSRAMPIVASLAKVKWFSRLGMAVAQRVADRSLVQVSRYLTDEQLRLEAQDRVLSLIDENTEIVIGHSLGSVVAFEALHRSQQRIALFVTLGSPLGLRSVVMDYLIPQPPSFPSSVTRWLNVAASDDVVAAQSDLTGLFGSVPDGATFEPAVRVGNGSSPHSSQYYLGKKQVGEAIAAALKSS